ncbi:DUF2064 domain-containing protein [Henriciella sp.]|uniref:TIGR04282 family arsenosugar biosynthesis glycosyltransferase n=1 Tax=Henriciella sp. TaxID=1968823 RepID=UPI002607A29A|nr:DUF2064 domain-containing protein [Henriciella sp.]
MMKPTVLIFAKPPRMGLSKTRLARDIGSTEARRIARFTLARTMRATMSPAWRTELHIAPPRAAGETLGGLWPPGLHRYAQVSGNLGDRMTHAMMQAPPGPVIFIGTDTPDIRRSHIDQCTRHLGTDRAVFGPATDGGFWLFGIGHRLRSPALFTSVRWSGPHAMEDVWSNLPARTEVTLLPQLIDLDTGEDWNLYKKQP